MEEHPEPAILVDVNAPVPHPSSGRGAIAPLAEVLEEAACLLDVSPESVWAGIAPDTLARMLRAERTALLETGTLRDRGQLEVLFLATGEIQDTSIDGGWGDRYLDLAERFDHALAAYTAFRSRNPVSSRPAASRTEPLSPYARRQRRHRIWMRGWMVAGVGLVVGVAVAGGAMALLGVGLMMAGVAVALAGSCFWLFQDGLFTHLPSAREVVRSPKRLLLLVIPAGVSLSLILWGAWLLGRFLEGS